MLFFADGHPQNMRNVDGERFERRHGGCAGSACPVIGRWVATVPSSVLCQVKPDTGAITCTWKEQAIHWICKVGGGRDGERQTDRDRQSDRQSDRDRQKGGGGGAERERAAKWAFRRKQLIRLHLKETGS